MMGVDAAQQAEMEMMIRELEAENRYISLQTFLWQSRFNKAGLKCPSVCMYMHTYACAYEPF